MFIATRGAQSYKFGAVEISIFARSAVELVTTKCRELENDLPRFGTDWQKLNREMIAQNSTSAPGHLIERFPELQGLTTGSLLLGLLPTPLAKVETDADGRFTVAIPSHGEFVCAATAKRELLDRSEEYYWVVPVPEREQVEPLLLSNNNLFTNVSLGTLVDLHEDGAELKD